MFDLPENAISKGLSDPQGAFKYIYNQLIYKDGYLTARWINQLINQRFRSPGELDVMKEDWDTLILIDACRFDYFSECADLPGTLSSKQSPASMSLGFIKENYIGRELHDTVYVTANPFASEIDSRTFHDVVSLIDDYYDNDAGTVPPEDLADAARKAHDNYPNKRIIVHFMQPHEPFLSEHGQWVSDRLKWKGNQYHLPAAVSLDDLQRAYQENLNVVLTHVNALIEEINGKIVVSSDHGELLGERLSPIPIRGLEHPEKIYEDVLLCVPWLEIDTDNRRAIKPDPPKEQNQIASKKAKKRLKQLGYV